MEEIAVERASQEHARAEQRADGDREEGGDQAHHQGSTAAVRDAGHAWRAGHPTLLIAFDSFERAARSQAAALGAPDLPIRIYAQYQPGAASDAVEAEKAVGVVRSLARCLTRAAP